jgi:hypothetical protein
MMCSAHYGRLAAFVAPVLAGLNPARATTIVRFDPPTKQVAVNAVFTMNIVADFSAPVAGWGLDMTVALPAIASQMGAPTLGNTWTAVFTPDGDNLGGLIFPNGAVGNGIVLATIQFKANAIGQTSVNTSVTVGDATEGFALDPSGFDAVTFQPGTITVVPEPLSGCLFFAGLLALPRRHRQRP